METVVEEDVQYFTTILDLTLAAYVKVAEDLWLRIEEDEDGIDGYQ